MKRGGGIKGLDDKSIGMEILMAEAFAKIKPTGPLIVARHTAKKDGWFIFSRIKKGETAVAGPGPDAAGLRVRPDHCAEPEIPVPPGKTLGHGSSPAHPGCLGHPQGPLGRLRERDSRCVARAGRRWAPSATWPLYGARNPPQDHARP
jgi:hypothetical protein